MLILHSSKKSTSRGGKEDGEAPTKRAKLQNALMRSVKGGTDNKKKKKMVI